MIEYRLVATSMMQFEGILERVCHNRRNQQKVAQNVLARGPSLTDEGPRLMKVLGPKRFVQLFVDSACHGKYAQERLQMV